MSKKPIMSETFSRNFFLNNLNHDNVDSEVYRTFKFIRMKDDIEKLKEKEDNDVRTKGN